jgi:hypothetical protein
MRRARLVIVVAVVLAGCGTAGDISRNKPSFQGSTAKLDSVYAACVRDRWLAISPTTHIAETPVSLQVVVSNATSSIEELLVIHSKASGADVVLYERMQVLALRAYRDSAKACL